MLTAEGDAFELSGKIGGASSVINGLDGQRVVHNEDIACTPGLMSLYFSKTRKLQMFRSRLLVDAQETEKFILVIVDPVDDLQDFGVGTLE